ncbi:adenylate/guanylate cyclase domain-containing protein [Marimonas sp. MJW-29]|uniref:Adenylate/guanylate cyclase domain-containing protein n=1 Tax=Sulfitobacter sediminis TaxID=3234186 RepID=A0ABV3RWB0_9RHOB
MITVFKTEELSTRPPQVANMAVPVAPADGSSNLEDDPRRGGTLAALLSVPKDDPDEVRVPARTAVRNSNKSFLTTILITDVVNSTEMAAELGDAKWREIVNHHDAIAMRTVARFDGTLLKFLGDGFISTFHRPSDAIACAMAFQAEIKQLSLSVRSGIHSGECLRTANDITGIAIAIAARVLKQAPAEAVWVSSTVRELLLGSGLNFVTVGSRKLRGVPNEWVLYEVVD